MFKFVRERVNFKEKLGEGAFGVVYAYQKDPTDKKWAVKNSTTRNVQEVLEYFQEITLGFSCNNPYVLPVKGYYIDYNDQKSLWDIYIKLPRMKSSLRSVIDEYKKKGEKVPEQMIAQYFYDIIQGLCYLHGRGIAHRDIHPGNILVAEDKSIRISDLGLVHFQSDESFYKTAEKAGHIMYAAPENLDFSIKLKSKDLLQTDLWSLGVLMFELCTQENLRVITGLNGAEKEAYFQKKLKEAGKNYSSVLIGLVAGLLHAKPSERKNLRDIEEELIVRYGSGLKMNHKEVQTEIAGVDKTKASQMPEKPKNKGDLKEIGDSQKGIEKLKEDLEKRWDKRFKIDIRNGKGITVTGRKTENSKDEAMIDFMKDVCELNDIYNSIKELELNIKGFAKISDERAPELGFQIGHLKDLQYLDVKFDGFDGPKIAEIMSHITNSLTHLDLDFKSSCSIGDQGIIGLASHIGSRLKNLQHLRLSFRNDRQISDQGVKKLAFQVGTHLKKLQHLHLHFQECSEISDQGVIGLASQIGLHLRSLQHLHLNFEFWEPSVKIGDQAIIELASQITYLKTLQHLHLVFFPVNATDKGITELASQIGTNLKTLQYLGLHLSVGDQGREGFQELASRCFVHLENLQHLHLDFQLCPLTAQTIKELGSQISARLRNLQHLHLDFGYLGDQISEQEFIELASQIGAHLRNLQHLYLNFTVLIHVFLTDQGVKRIASQICSNLKSLQSLQLIFTGCQKISDEAVNDLATRIGTHLNNLQHLHLDFRNCPLISDQSVIQLTSHIGSDLINLQHLHLDFSDCPKISDQIVKELAFQIGAHLQKIQRLYLDLRSTQVSFNYKKFLRKHFSNIANLQVL